MESVRRIRREKGLSQQELADLAGVGQDSISAIETGKHEPHPRTLRKLAKALEIEVRSFFEEPALAGKAAAPPPGPQPGEELRPRSVGQQLAEDPAGDVNLLESWASEGGNTGRGHDSLLVVLLKLDTELQSAGDDRDNRLVFIDDRMSEEDSPTILKWLDTRREWVERGIYKPMHPMTAQAAARRVERLLKA